MASSRHVLQEGQDPTDVEVLLDDQNRINAFGRLNTRHEELTVQANLLADRLQSLVDAGEMVEMCMDDDDCLLQIGELFMATTEEEATEFVAQTKAKVAAEHAALTAEKENIADQLKQLKAQLYAKFGSSINLDTEPVQ